MNPNIYASFNQIHQNIWQPILVVTRRVSSSLHNEHVVTNLLLSTCKNSNFTCNHGWEEGLHNMKPCIGKCLS